MKNLLEIQVILNTFVNGRGGGKSSSGFIPFITTGSLPFLKY